MKNYTTWTGTMIAAILTFSSGWALAQADTDGDGIPDGLDEYPCNIAQSATAYAPAEGQYGLILFEDQWTNKGDLDFNDAALAYNYVFGLDDSGLVTKMTLTIHAKALGGTFDNGLGLHLPIPQTAVSQVTRRIGGGTTTTLPIRSDAELTIDLSSNMREFFGGALDQINSRPDLARVQGQTMTVTIDLSTPFDVSSALAPFDIFIFRTADRTHEIHLPDFFGTAAMNTALFGTGDDGSAGSRYFVDFNGLPFALVLPVDAYYPVEAQLISGLYPNIIGFAASGGTTNQDFYVAGVDATLRYLDANGLGAPSSPTIAPVTPDRTCVPVPVGPTATVTYDFTPSELSEFTLVSAPQIVMDGALSVAPSAGTDLTAPGGPIFFSNQYNNAGYSAANAFNDSGRGGTGWIMYPTPGYQTGFLTYDFGAPTVVTAYRMATHSSGTGGGYITDWQILGSNDNSNFTPLHTVSGATAPGAQFGQIYSFVNSTAYRYIRMEVSAGGGSWPGLEELEYFGAPTYDDQIITTSDANRITNLASVTSVTVQATEPTGSHIRFLASFDGRRTWSAWNGSAWATVSLDSIATQGMSVGELEGVTTSQWDLGHTYLVDFAIGIGGQASLASVDVGTILHPVVGTIGFDSPSGYIRSSSIDVAINGTANTVSPVGVDQTLPSGTIFFSNQYNSAGYSAANAFNNSGRGGSGWIMHPTPGYQTGWLTYDFGTARTLTGYRIAMNSSGTGSGSIHTWTIRGSNNTTTGNDGTWTVLSTVSNYPSPGTGFTPALSLDTTTPFRFYQLNVTGGGGSWPGVEEIEYFASANYPNGHVTTTDTTQITRVLSVNDVAIRQSEPGTSRARYLVSFDGRATWQAFSGNSWGAVSLSNVNSVGMSAAAVMALAPSQWALQLNGTLDFAVGLSSTDGSASAFVDAILVAHQRLPIVTTYEFTGNEASQFIQSSATVTNFDGTLNVSSVVGQDLTSPGGPIFFSNQYNTSGYSAANAFNNIASTGWIMYPTPGYQTGFLTYDFGGPLPVTGYRLQCNAGGTGGGNINSWAISGSNDNIAFTQIDQRNQACGSSFSPILPLSSTTQYRYYRLDVFSGGGSWPGIAEMEYVSNVPTYQDVYVTTGNGNRVSNVDSIEAVEISQTTPSGTDIRYLMSFDGRSTWYAYNGTAWASASLSAIHTAGMTASTLTALGTQEWFTVPSGTTVDIAIGLSNTNNAGTASVDQIRIVTQAP